MDYEYDIAISFAGEDRNVAEQIANRLRSEGVNVFYDNHELANLWGKDLYVHLHEVYSTKARYCIMLLSKHYAIKTWTNHERQSAQERAFKESEEYILPVRIDNTSIPGIRETVGYISLQNTSIDQLAELIFAKLGKNVSSVSAPKISHNVILPKIKKEFTDRDKDRFLIDTFQSMSEYFKQGISKLNEMDGIEGEFTQINAAKFICVIYQGGKRRSECTVWYGGSSFDKSCINYVSKADPNAGSTTNEKLYIDLSSGALGLKPIMRMDGHRDEVLDPKGATEYLWLKLIRPLGT